MSNLRTFVCSTPTFFSRAAQKSREACGTANDTVVTWPVPVRRSGHVGQPAGDAPGDLHLAGDGGDRARGVDWQGAAVQRGGLSREVLHKTRMAARKAGLRRQREELRRARVGGYVNRVAEARDDLLPGLVVLHDPARCCLKVVTGRRLLEDARRLLDRAAEAVAHAEEAGRDGRLQRLRRAEIGHAGSDRARGQTVLDQRHHQRVEHDRLLGRRQAGHQHEEGEVAQRDLADELLGQDLAADEDLVGRPAAEPRLQLARHRRTVRRVLYPASPNSDSGTSSTLLRNISLAWIAFSISVTRAPSDSWRSVISTSTGIGGSIDVSGPSRITRARPVTRGRKSPTTARIAAGYTFTPRTMNMSSRRPSTRCRKLVRPHSHSVPSMRTMSPPRNRTTGIASRVSVV